MKIIVLSAIIAYLAMAIYVLNSTAITYTAVR